MNSLIVTATLCISVLLAWHMWLNYKAGGYSRHGDGWAMCPCGHAANLHATFTDGSHKGGCRSGDSRPPVTDCYGYCKCPATRESVIGAPVGADQLVGGRG